MKVPSLKSLSANIKRMVAGAALVTVAAAGVIVSKPAHAEVDIAGALLNIAANLVSQTVQSVEQYVVYREEPGNYSAWDSFWNIFFPRAADKPLSSGNNTWGNYQIPSVATQVQKNGYFFWQKVTLPLSSGASCIDGSEYKFFVNLTNASNNFLIWQQPGGACTDYGTCTGLLPQMNNDGTWKLDQYGNVQEVVFPRIYNGNGISDNFMDVWDNVIVGANRKELGWLFAPFLKRLSLLDTHRIKAQDWNIIVLPYCTGDTHIGDNTAHLVRVDGRQGKIFNFNGTKNVVTSLGWLRDNLPRPAQVFLTGSSAGSLGVDFHRATVRKILNPSDSLYTLADSGFITSEDPQGTDLINFPNTGFLKQAKAAWWNYDVSKPDQSSSFVANLKKEIPDFNAKDVSNVGTLISQKYPQDRMLYANFQSDINIPNAGTFTNPEYLKAALATGDINYTTVPAYFSPLGDYVLNKVWRPELDRLITRVSGLTSNQGYFFDLAHSAFGQAVLKHNLSGHFVGRQALAAVFDDLRFGQVRPRALDHKQAHRFSRLVIGNARAGALQHACQGAGHGLNLVGVDVEPGDQHHVFLAVGDAQKAALVKVADVAGAEVAVGGKGRSVRFGLLPVPRHDLRARGADLTRLARAADGLVVGV
ncbi:MAG: hypothetical protein C4K60_19730 [Ideonella sp. MAG2]|nr:MAG: hypothetical protein C4K60_19730 [Ideonella sp. MAG2]